MQSNVIKEKDLQEHCMGHSWPQWCVCMGFCGERMGYTLYWSYSENELDFK